MRILCGRFVMAAMGLTMVVALSAACGESSGSAPDYGPYSTRAVAGDYDRAPSRARGIMVESLRLGEHIVYPADIDPDLSTGRGGGVLIDFQGASNMASTAQRKVFARYTGLAGFATSAADKPDTGDPSSGKRLSVNVFELSDEQAASAAAADLEQAEFGNNPDNAPIALDSVPGSVSHWSPGGSSLSSWLAWKTLVIQVQAQLPGQGLEPLIDRVARAYQRQQAALAGFVPTPASELPTLSLDPDNLLPRLVKTGEYQPDETLFSVYGPRAYAAVSDAPATDFGDYQRDGVTAVALSYNKRLFRARDAGAAADLARALGDRDTTSHYQPMRGVSGQAGTTCTRATAPGGILLTPHRFRCVIARDAAVALVYSNSETDVRQLAAAQYAVMGDVS